ncbi:MAG: dynamin family protein [Firmicutes bacterium]|nr:dynamin family protein [Bacillota bacterium]
MVSLHRFIAAAEEIISLLPVTAPLRVAVLGSFNCGKSTLVNGLLGEKISPVGAVPTTAGPVIFRYGDTFLARVACAGKTAIFTGRESYFRHVAGTPKKWDKIEIEIPAPLLKYCTLTDTPGIDSPGTGATSAAFDAAAGADILLFLFHQRGLDEANRIFLQKMAGLRKGKGEINVSFWINCNHGPCDGTSLKSTGEDLRRIFLHPVPLYAVNLSSEDGVRAVSLHLEIELKSVAIRLAGRSLQELDRSIPGKLEYAAGIKDDRHFLSEFWAVRELAGKILAAGCLLNNLPPVKRELDELLSAPGANARPPAAAGTGGTNPRFRLESPDDLKNLFHGFLARLRNDRQVRELAGPGALDRIAGRLAGERFTVLATGGFSTGKTTFFNALMKEELLPVADGPTTAAVTRIAHGTDRAATIRFALQVTLPVYETGGGRAVLCRDEVLALESWLAEQAGEIAALEAEVNGRFSRVSRRELALALTGTKRLFAAGKAAAPSGTGAPPLIFRCVPAGLLPPLDAPRKVRVTFHHAGSIRLDLSTPEGRRDFCRAAGPANAFRLDSVAVESPARYLKLATFIDSPGFDSVQRYHRDKVRRLTEESDAVLFFLNGRQVLTGVERQISGLETETRPLLQPGTTAAREKTFFLVNFADTLTPAEREAVSNYLRRSLTPGGHFAPAPPQRIFFISALAGLRGEDGGLALFLKNLEEFAARQRRLRFYGPLAVEIGSLLAAAMESAGDRLNDPAVPYSAKKELRLAVDRLRHYRRELKDIKNSIHLPGGG